MHREIEDHEQHIQGLRQYSSGAGGPPLILPPTHEQAVQLALYRIRAAYERDTYAWPDSPSGSPHSGGMHSAQNRPQQMSRESNNTISRLIDQDSRTRQNSRLSSRLSE